MKTSRKKRVQAAAESAQSSAAAQFEAVRDKLAPVVESAASTARERGAQAAEKVGPAVGSAVATMKIASSG